jgi:DNA-directed RNA polymerase subunit M/transcription elongation factor TFIIS
MRGFTGTTRKRSRKPARARSCCRCGEADLVYRKMQKRHEKELR